MAQSKNVRVVLSPSEGACSARAWITRRSGSVAAPTSHSSGRRSAYRSGTVPARRRARCVIVASRLLLIGRLPTARLSSGAMTGKDGARTHAQRSPQRACGSGNEHEREDGAGPSLPKRQCEFADAVAAACDAPLAPDAAAGSLSAPRSALKRVAGEYDAFPGFRHV